ncbi:MAG: SAM-dependent methyltransferase [Bacteroidaceae bacterium]
MTDRDLTEQFIMENRTADVRSLALSHHPQGVDMRYALTQIAGWQTARLKVPLWAATDGIVYPKRLSLEQSTSQPVAECKAKFIENLFGAGFKTADITGRNRKSRRPPEPGAGFRMADLTGGMGVDCFFLSRSAALTCYNEISDELCAIAAVNFKALGRQDIKISCRSAEDFISGLEPDSFDILYIDPARRSNTGRKLISIVDYQPDITAMQENLLRVSRYVMVKLSPLLDITQTLTEIKNVSRVIITGLDGECKELLLLMQRGFASETQIEAIDIFSNGNSLAPVVSTREKESALPLPIAHPLQLRPGTYIGEPSAPYMKSALFRTIADRTGTALLHPDSHLFWSSDRPLDFPGRLFTITGIIPFDKRSLAPLARTRANLSVRNFPDSAPQLQHKLKLRDGGDRYLIATTLADTRKVLLDLKKTLPDQEKAVPD